MKELRIYWSNNGIFQCNYKTNLLILIIVSFYCSYWQYVRHLDLSLISLRLETLATHFKRILEYSETKWREGSNNKKLAYDHYVYRRTFLLVDNIFNFRKYDDGNEWVLVFHISDHVNVYAHLLDQSYLI